MEALLDMFRQTIDTENYRIDQQLLRENNFSESQWHNFIDLVNDLDLNEVGIRIMIDEIRSGRVLLK